MYGEKRVADARYRGRAVVTILDQTSLPAGCTLHRAASRRAWLTGRRAVVRSGGAGLPRLALHTVARGVALFFGLFALLNLVGQLHTPGFDQNIWWLDLRPLPGAVSAALLGVAGVLLVWWAGRPAASLWRRSITAATVAVLAAVAVKNGVTFYHVWRDGLISPRVPVPLSFVLAAVLSLLAATIASRSPAPSRERRWTRLCTLLAVAATLLACGVLFPLAQQVFFGMTTYTRPADLAVVFGAQVHRDGHASISLRDRILTAAWLYRAGSAGRLVMSGAQGAGEPFNEASVMRSLAVAYGVPASAVSTDPAGFNTDATVRDTAPMLSADGVRTVAVVSDFFHLPRIKLAYQRAGYDVITVPARERRRPPVPVILREIPAFWVYYLRAIL